MVWGLIPLDSPRGTQKYYIFSAGTYKVGRKDCDVIVQTDTSISRVHAEIIVEKMICWDPSHVAGPANYTSHIRIVDRSKYGTFINREDKGGSNRLSKDEESVLKDGDLVTFGTGNATFRFTFIPLIVFLDLQKPARVDRSLQAAMNSIGAYTTRKWINDCTHVICDEFSQVTVEIIESVLARKEIVSKDWFKMLAEQSTCTEIPSSSSYVPRLTLDGIEIKSVESKLRENCLQDYTFIMGSLEKYKFGEKIHSLLEIAGAKFLQFQEYCSNNQRSADEDGNQLILVVPAKSPLEFNQIKELNSLSKVTDLKLIVAVLSGRLEPTVIEPPAFIVSSSNSTDETIVAESDIEIDTATSLKSQNEFEIQDGKENKLKSVGQGESVNIEQRESRVDISKVDLDNKLSQDMRPKNENIRVIERVKNGDNSRFDRDEHSDIIFSQDLIVRNMCTLPSVISNSNVVNFKRFRKREVGSGNSFSDLVRFSKDPYKESDEEYNKSSEYMREEKKRKQLEAIAEDLFNNEKARKRANGGTSIHALLAGR